MPLQILQAKAGRREAGGQPQTRRVAVGLPTGKSPRPPAIATSANRSRRLRQSNSLKYCRRRPADRTCIGSHRAGWIDLDALPTIDDSGLGWPIFDHAEVIVKSKPSATCMIEVKVVE